MSHLSCMNTLAISSNPDISKSKPSVNPPFTISNPPFTISNPSLANFSMFYAVSTIDPKSLLIIFSPTSAIDSPISFNFSTLKKPSPVVGTSDFYNSCFPLVIAVTAMLANPWAPNVSYVFESS